MYNFFLIFCKLYTFLIKSQFGHFGKGSLVKPFLNTANSKFIDIGESVNIGLFSWIAVSTDFGGYQSRSRSKIRLKIGDHTDIGNNAFIVANNNVEIGSHVILAPYVYISDHIHRFDNIDKNLHEQALSEDGFVKIGDNVFIGIKASILPNIVIGEHAVIGANSVVTKDVPSYSVAVGNPARVVKKYSFEKNEWIRVEN